MTRTKKPKTTKIDYTLEQFLAEAKNRERINRILEKILKTIERLDNRISRLEKQ